MIPLFKVFMAPEAGEELNKVLYSGYITQGKKVEEFEWDLQEWLGVRYLNTVNAGTNALQLALHLAGITPEKGGKVISTPMTCSATNTAIKAMGGEIVWADIDPMTGNISSQSVEDRIINNPDAKTVMIVHWGGRPCNLEQFSYLSKRYGVKIIEDAAHAFGAVSYGHKIGCHSDFVCFSFQAIKHLTTIDGGAVVTREQGDYERGKLLRWFGIDRNQPRGDFRCEADIVEAGYKYHMNDVNAAVGLANLSYMRGIVRQHVENGEFYNKALTGIPEVGIPSQPSAVIPSYWIYTIHVPNRDAFMKYMTSKGIVTSQVHARNDLHTMFQKYRVDLPGVDAFTATQVNIPVGWWVTEKDREYIVKSIREFYGRQNG